MTDLDVNVATLNVNVAHLRTTLQAMGGSIVHAPALSTLTPIPPPSIAFTGREDVPSKMKHYFSPSATSVHSKQQHIYVLYGMGGAGKTQIALKFIQQNADW